MLNWRNTSTEQCCQSARSGRLVKFTGKTNDFVVNTVLHEIGHTFNLDHCDKDERCLMNDAKGTIATLYKEQKWLCPACVKLLKKANIVHS